jgi:hypothetical protein
MKKVAFYSPQMGLRGTEVTLYDFAHFNETILGNKSIIIYARDNKRSHPSAQEKFAKRFDEIYTVSGDGESNPNQVNSELNEILKRTNSDYFYLQKGGWNDGVCPTACKTLILCCTLIDPVKERHGDKYAFVSYWLSKVCSNGTVPVVPSMVYLPKVDGDLREELNIPKNAVVFARTGGHDTWNIPWTNAVIAHVLQNRKDAYFLFQNTPKFIEHERVIHVPSTADMEYKVKFINTCDAMLHSREEGESFGVTCGEFSLRNKRVITYGQARERNHIEILKDKGLYFNNPQDLFDILMTYVPDYSQNWNCYEDYSPEKVIKIFDDVFLKDN